MISKEQIMNGTRRQWRNNARWWESDICIRHDQHQLMVKFLNGELDAVALMRHELRNRGLGDDGSHIGFNLKEEEWEYEFGLPFAFFQHFEATITAGQFLHVKKYNLCLLAYTHIPTAQQESCLYTHTRHTIWLFWRRIWISAQGFRKEIQYAYAISHGGDDTGSHSICFLLPKTGNGLIIFSNSDNAPTKVV